MGKKYEHSHLINNAKTGAGRRAVTSRLPKTTEAPKNLLLLKGHATSAVGTALLNDLNMLKRPLCRKLQRKNEVLPFESGGEAHLENLCRLNDCSMFALVNHTKKRPHNLIVGRTFGHRILEMFEFGITGFQPMAAFPRTKSAQGSVPMVVFNGDDFEASEKTQMLRSVLLDLFRAPDDMKLLNLTGLDRVVVFTLRGESSIMFRQYSVSLKRSTGSSLPDPELLEVGPHFDLCFRRSQLPPEALMKDAMKKPRDPAVVPKKKNVSRDELGDKVGRVHVGRQDLSSLALARMKGLGKKRKVADAAADDSSNGELEKDDENGEVSGDSALSNVPDRNDSINETENPKKKVRFQARAETETVA